MVAIYNILDYIITNNIATAFAKMLLGRVHIITYYFSDICVAILVISLHNIH